MDKTQVLTMLSGIIIRGLAWVLAAKLGYDASHAATTATELVGGISAVVITAISIWHSYQTRKTLLMTPPPDAAKAGVP